MDMLENGLDQGQEKTDGTEDQAVLVTQGDVGDEQNVAVATVSAASGGITLDPSSAQYQYRADNTQGQVTYRVVQVQDGGDTQGQVLATTALPAGTHVAQAVIQSPFSNGGSPSPETNEQRFAYFPAVSVNQDNNAAADISHAAIGQVAQAGGQFYVMMSPQDVIQGQRTIAPRTGYSPKEMGNRTTRDERRRATHNEVERRRRDKINNWIVNLSKLIPDCTAEHSKQGQVSNASKGGILAKACDYIQELRTSNSRMGDSLKDTERLSVDVELLRQQVDELKNENAILRAQLQSHGIPAADIVSGN